MPEITPESTAKALATDIERRLAVLERIAATGETVPAMADLVSAIKIAADILIDVEALAPAAFDEPQQTVFRSVLARLARAKEGKAVTRAVAEFRTAIHPILVRAKPYDPDDYPF